MKTFCKYSLSGGGNFNPTDTLIKGFLSLLFITATLTACNDADEAIPTQATKLNINVQTAKIETRGLIESATLPDGDAHSIGLMLVDEGGATYDNRTYNNVKVTPSTGEGKQVWTPAGDILLSSTTGTLYGYYPYNEDVTDITQVPVAADDTDYMYATPVEKLDDGNYHAAVTMKHALAAIRLNIVKGTYTGTGAVSSVSVSGDNIATSGKLNAKTGALTSLSGTGSAVTNSTAFTLSTTAKQIDYIIVPVTTSSAAPTFTMTIDGKEYNATPSAVTLEQGTIYEYTLTINAKDISLSDVKVGDWGYNNSGNPVIDLGYKVTLGGNMKDIALSNTIEGSTVTITAVPFIYSKGVNEVDYEGDATVVQSLDEDTGIRTITVYEVNSDINIDFSGTNFLLKIGGDCEGMVINKSVAEDGTVTITATPTEEYSAVLDVIGEGAGDLTQTVDNQTGIRTIIVNNHHGIYNLTFNGYLKYKNIDLTTAKNGVYAVDVNGKGVLSDYADESCIAVALIVNDADTPQRIMIEKNGEKNTTSIKAAYSADGATNTDYTYFYWGPYDTDVSAIGNWTGGNDSSIPEDYKTWKNNSTYAWNDYNGKVNTVALMNVKDSDSYNLLANMGTYCANFNATATENQGFSDWYIPSCGQLAFIYINVTDINTALDKIGGTKFDMTKSYWSSSEYDSRWGNEINFRVGMTNNYNMQKTLGKLVRFVRDINQISNYISFTINGDFYIAEEGMTWEELANSNCNPISSFGLKFSTFNSEVFYMFNSGFSAIIKLNDINVLPTDKIIPGTEYKAVLQGTEGESQ